MSIRPDVPAALVTAAAASHVAWFPLVYMNLDDGPLRLSGADFDVTYDGHVWTSARGLGSFEPIGESADEMEGLKFTLSGMPPGVVAEALVTKVQGRACTVLYAVVEEDGTLRVDPNAWSGKLDGMQVERSDGTCVIVVTAEHAMLDWSRPRTRYFNDADQKRVDPSDKFFSLIAGLNEKVLVIFSKEAQAARAKRLNGGSQ